MQQTTLFSALYPTVSLPSARTSELHLQLTKYSFHSYSAVNECLYVSHSLHRWHVLRSPTKSIVTIIQEAVHLDR
jgi:hypothetical protein